MNLYEPPKSKDLHEASEALPILETSRFGRINVRVIRNGLVILAGLNFVSFIGLEIRTLQEFSAPSLFLNGTISLAYCLFFLVLGRAIWLRQTWSRVVGFVTGLMLLVPLIAMPSISGNLVILILAGFGVALVYSLSVGWRYGSEQMALQAQQQVWGNVPVSKRYGAAFLVYLFGVSLGSKVIPTFQELFAEQGLTPNFYVEAFPFINNTLLLVTVLCWLLIPPRLQVGRLTAKVLLLGGLALIFLAMGALYEPIFR